MVIVLIKVTNTFLTRLIQGMTKVLDSYVKVSGYFHQFYLKKINKIKFKLSILAAAKNVKIKCAHWEHETNLQFFGHRYWIEAFL